MALAAAITWEVRTTGADTNGGGFKAGASGTDWSQQNTAQYAVADAVTDGTTTITSATASFGTDVVGNVLYITGGTAPITAGWYEIASRTSATAIVVDRSTGLTAGTGATLNIGGALATLGTVAPIAVGSNKIFVQASAGFSTTATITFAQSVTPDKTTPFTRLIGYTTVRTDAGKATLTLSTNTGLTAILSSGNGFSVENFSVNCASLGTSTGINLNGGGQYGRVRNCKVANFTTAGIVFRGSTQSVVDCEVTGGTAAATAAMNCATAAGATGVLRNWVHDNACPGLVATVGQPGSIIWNLFTNNTGASSDGVRINFGSVIVNNVFYKNGRDGLRQNDGNTVIGTLVRNNIFAQNSGYGMNAQSGAGTPADLGWDGNAYFSNTSGARNNLDSITGIDAISPYTNTLDVTLTGDPFTNAAADDYSLNNTAGAGAACRATGTPGAFPVGSTTAGKLDIGAVQHADPAASGGSAVAIFGG